MSSQQQDKQALTRFSEPRIPYDARLEKQFGISRSHWRLLVEQTFPAAKTAEGILLAVSYCRTRKLDIFKRPVHVVPIWDSQQGKEVESVWPGIGELRITAARTRLYAGRDKAEWGEDKTREFTGFTKKGGDRKITVTFPEWCQVTVYKMVDGHRCAFEGPKVYWEETYAKLGKTILPNSMWENRPRGQLEKCAEAAALRAAFPEEIGDDYIPEEAETAFMRDVTPPRPTMEDFEEQPEPEPEQAEETSLQKVQESQPADEADDFPGDKPLPEQKTTSRSKASKATKAEPEPDSSTEDAPVVSGGPIDFLANWKAALSKCKTDDDLIRLQRVNGKRIAGFNEELRNLIDEATALRKEALSQ